jgi:C4-type Zn-finger protein
MGIYNIVNFSLNCPVCGSLIKQFQTKEGNGVFDVVAFNEVNNFYAICPSCSSLVEFYYSPENKERTIEDYKARIISTRKNDRY